eukprot:s3410_g1.t1
MKDRLSNHCTVTSTFTQFDLNLKEGAASVDADEAKKHKIRMSIMEEDQDSLMRLVWSLACRENVPWLRGFVDHPGFDLFFATVVITNSIFIGV